MGVLLVLSSVAAVGRPLPASERRSDECSSCSCSLSSSLLPALLRLCSASRVRCSSLPCASSCASNAPLRPAASSSLPRAPASASLAASASALAAAASRRAAAPSASLAFSAALSACADGEPHTSRSDLEIGSRGRITPGGRLIA